MPHKIEPKTKARLCETRITNLKYFGYHEEKIPIMRN